MRVDIKKKIVVITPSVGRESLKKAVESVKNQSYGEIEHLVVSDGPEFFTGVAKMVGDQAKITCSPTNTGKGGFYGHRIYASYPHLVDAEYVAFLDEDNWYEPNHIESMMDRLESDNLDWVYSLRNVWLHESEGGTFLDQDCCESIGEWPIFFTVDTCPQHLADTSTYLFSTNFLINVCHNWHYGWGGDRRFFTILMNGNSSKGGVFGTTGLHTLNYRLPPIKTQYGGEFGFFKRGNKITKEKYGGKYPWQK